MNPLIVQESELVNRFSWSFFGCFCQQRPEAILAINRLLLCYDFSRIIELGTHLGGLSTLFALYCHGSEQPIVADPTEPCLAFNDTHHKVTRDFYTFDNVCRDKSRFTLINLLGARAELRDFLDNPDDIAHIRDLIKSDGRTLLLCDGGNKKRELDLYAGSMQHGDIVMAHDWAKDEKAFAALREEGWTSWESRWEDGPRDTDHFGIREICERERIVQVFPDEFDKTAWFCGVKT